MRLGNRGERSHSSKWRVGTGSPICLAIATLCASMIALSTVTCGVLGAESDGLRPGPPINLAAQGGDGFVLLTWEPPEEDGASPVLYYILYRGNDPDLMSDLGHIGNVTSYNDNNLVENGVTYYYRVRAINEYGEGNLSEAVSATPLGVPGVPSSVSASKVDGTVRITWNRPTQDGGSPILNYRLYRGTSTGQPVPYATVGNTTFSYTDGNVSEGEIYSYRLLALNEVGDGPLSTAVSVSFVDEGESYDLLILVGLVAVAIVVAGVVLVRRLRR
jgi:fibronectin type 3 domain-containing protein